MAKRGRKKRAGKREDRMERFIRPTEAREVHNHFQGAGAAVRVVPVIETLLRTERITQSEFDRLAYYREQAHKAEDDIAGESPLSPQRIMGGVTSSPTSGKIPTAVLLATPAIIETARIERDLGSLLDIARAIAVDDLTLSQWCIRQHGGRERYSGNGKFIAVVPIAEKKVMDKARLELRMAARRIIP